MPFPLKALVLFTVGIIAGVINALAGGGTLLSFPTLIFTGVPPVIANATSTVALLVGTVASFISYRREFVNQKRWAVRFGPPSALGGLLGAILLLHTSEHSFQVIIPYLILFATVLFTFQPMIARWLQIEAATAQKSRHGIAAAMFFQFFVGIYGGYFGAGIGILMLAALQLLVPADVHEMNSLKVLLASLINSVAAAYFIIHGGIVWVDVLLLAIGATIGGYSGPVLGRKVGGAAVRGFVTVVGFAIGFYFLFKK
jgi:uncharacterized membrane protein YfcA